MIIASFPKGSFPENSWPVGTWPVAPAVVDIQYTEVMEFAVCIAASAEFDVIMPNASSATGAVTVSGAGTSEANGTYTYAGEAYGKPYYTSNVNMIYWFGLSFNIWVIATNAGGVYQSSEDVATPNLVTTWLRLGAGSAPVPTVTSTSPLSGISVIAAFTVEMPTVIDFELYEELSK